MVVSLQQASDSLIKDESLARILTEIQQTQIMFNTTLENLQTQVSQVMVVAELPQEEKDEQEWT